jgi:hypothetical protein
VGRGCSIENVKGAGNLLADESNEIFTPYQQRSPLFTFGEASDVSTGTGVFVWRSEMSISEKYQNQIDEIMDNFDFDRVHKMMASTNWFWHSDGGAHIPSQPELREAARSCLRKVVEKDCSMAGHGGFAAINQEGCLSLYWGLSWECVLEEEGDDN